MTAGNAKLVDRLSETAGRLLLAPWRIILRRRMKQVRRETICEQTIVVYPDVFNPVIFRSGRIFAEYLHEHLRAASPAARLEVLDMGTGSGVLAIICAALGHRVVAVELNPVAVRCAIENAGRLPEDLRPDVIEGDLFEPVAGRRFDLVLWNPPFFQGEPKSLLDLSWRSDNGIGRFFAQLQEHLRPGGRAMIIWTSQAAAEHLHDSLRQHDLRCRTVHSQRVPFETFTIFEITF